MQNYYFITIISNIATGNTVFIQPKRISI